MHARVATLTEGTPISCGTRSRRSSSRASRGHRRVCRRLAASVASGDEGKVIAISLFESEADLPEGDATLNSMDLPVPGGLGQRTSVEVYQVGVKFDA